jgi:hypothetical protein
LIGQTVQLVKFRSTEIPNQTILGFLVSRFLWNVRKYLGITPWWWRQSKPVSTVRPIWVEISNQTVRHKTAYHNVNFANFRALHLLLLTVAERTVMREFEKCL